LRWPAGTAAPLTAQPSHGTGRRAFTAASDRRRTCGRFQAWETWKGFVEAGKTDRELGGLQRELEWLRTINARAIAAVEQRKVLLRLCALSRALKYCASVAALRTLISTHFDCPCLHRQVALLTKMLNKCLNSAFHTWKEWAMLSAKFAVRRSPFGSGSGRPLRHGSSARLFGTALRHGSSARLLGTPLRQGSSACLFAFV
jgi:hypothetical protein